MYTLATQQFKGKFPQFDPESFVAPGCYVYGDVRVGKYASLWPGVVARGDVAYISIGECTNIQDLTCLHVSDNMPCIIGDYVTVGHCALLHACTIEDHVLIGMHATVMDGAVVGRGSIIAAGAMVLRNQVIPPNSLVVGLPGKVVRTKDELAQIHAQALKYKTEWAVEYGAHPHISGELYHGEPIV